MYNVPYIVILSKVSFRYSCIRHYCVNFFLAEGNSGLEAKTTSAISVTTIIFVATTATLTLLIIGILAYVLVRR